MLLAICASLLLSIAAALPAIAAPEYNESGPAGTASVSLRPFGQGQLALSYTFVDTQGATATEITLTPVGLNSDASTYSYGGNRASGMVIYPYVEGEEVSVGLHVIFLTPVGVQDNSANPIVVSYPR